jgi:hypothetical protein
MPTAILLATGNKPAPLRRYPDCPGTLRAAAGARVSGHGRFPAFQLLQQAVVVFLQPQKLLLQLGTIPAQP